MKGLPHSCRDLERHIILRSATPPAVGSVAVGWVLDDNGAEPDEDLDVVVAIGINYGQGAWYLHNPVNRTTKTGMRTRLSTADAAIAAHKPPGCAIRRLPPNGFHLVVGNFFPWITSLAWSQYGFNAIEEALLLHCSGYSNPLGHIDRLFVALPGTVTHVAFHGANNAVPLLGIQFVNGHSHLLQERMV